MADDPRHFRENQYLPEGGAIPTSLLRGTRDGIYRAAPDDVGDAERVLLGGSEQFAVGVGERFAGNGRSRDCPGEK